MVKSGINSTELHLEVEHYRYHNDSGEKSRHRMLVRWIVQLSASLKIALEIFAHNGSKSKSNIRSHRHLGGESGELSGHTGHVQVTESRSVSNSIGDGQERCGSQWLWDDAVDEYSKNDTHD